LYEDEIALIITEHVNSRLIENHQKLSYDNTIVDGNLIQIEKSNTDLEHEIIKNKDKIFDLDFDKLSLDKNTVKERKFSPNGIIDEKLMKFEINNQILESACDFLIERASKGILLYFYFYMN
jgi:hypothetical protein